MQIRWAAGWLPKTINLIFSILLTFFGLLLVTFLIGRVIPIDPVLAIVGDRALPDVYARVRQELALDEPLYYQFWLYMTKVLQGDFGKSVITSKPVIDDIIRFFPATIELATLATLLGALIGVPMGVLAAKFQGRWVDHIIRVLGLVGYSVPVFWLGLVGLLVFYTMARLGLGYRPPRCLLRRHRHSPHRPHVGRSAIARRMGHLLQRGQPSHPAGIAARLLLARLYQPHDAQLHARAAEPGIM